MVWGQQDPEVVVELLGKTQPHDIRRKGVSGRGSGKGKSLEVGEAGVLEGEAERRQGPRRLRGHQDGWGQDGEPGRRPGGSPGDNLHGHIWVETPPSSPPAQLPCAPDVQWPLTGFLEKALPPHLPGKGLS